MKKRGTFICCTVCTVLCLLSMMLAIVILVLNEVGFFKEKIDGYTREVASYLLITENLLLYVHVCSN